MKTVFTAMLASLALVLSEGAAALCTLVCACSVSTTAVSFGTYNPLSGSVLDATGNVRVTCGGVLGLGVPYQIKLNKGQYSSDFSPRKMASGANRLNYDLYTDASRQTIWQDASPNWVTGSITIVLLGGTSNDHTVYGRIPTGQPTVPPGNYADTVLVTVEYQ